MLITDWSSSRAHFRWFFMSYLTLLSNLSRFFFAVEPKSTAFFMRLPFIIDIYRLSQ